MPLKQQADRAAGQTPLQEKPREESEQIGRSEPEWIEMVLSLAEPAAAQVFRAQKKEAGVRDPASSGKRRSAAFAGTLKVRPVGPA